MTITAIITVTTEVGPDDLHEDDGEIVGVYGVRMGDGPGEYPATPRNAVEEGDSTLREAALDVFHDHVGIHVLDDFDIAVAVPVAEADAPDEVYWL
jgi:hypothetical protein